MNLKAIAVDDEQHCLDTLIWELQRNCPEVEMVHTINEEDRARELIPVTDFDILFMDIHLQSTSGIELVKSLQPLDCHVVFVTAYDQYAIEAFEIAATHYLLKPINADKLRTAVDRIIEYKRSNDKVTLENIIAALSNTNQNQRRIAFSIQSGIEFVLPEDIVYVAGENNYSVLYFLSGKKLMVSKTLSVVEGMLSDFTFMRIHKSYLVNLKHIVRYVKADGGYLEVKGGDQLGVSRTKRATIHQLFS